MKLHNYCPHLKRSRQAHIAAWSELAWEHQVTHHKYCCLLRGVPQVKKKSNCEDGSLYWMRAQTHRKLGFISYSLPLQDLHILQLQIFVNICFPETYPSVTLEKSKLFSWLLWAIFSLQHQPSNSTPVQFL